MKKRRFGKPLLDQFCEGRQTTWWENSKMPNGITVTIYNPNRYRVRVIVKRAP